MLVGNQWHRHIRPQDQRGIDDDHDVQREERPVDSPDAQRSTFTGYVSVDGVTWTTVGTTSIALTTTVQLACKRPRARRACAATLRHQA